MKARYPGMLASLLARTEALAHFDTLPEEKLSGEKRKKKIITFDVYVSIPSLP